MHPNHLKQAIQRTKKQLTKQRNKLHYSKDENDKATAKDEIDRLQLKLAQLLGL